MSVDVHAVSANTNTDKNTATDKTMVDSRQLMLKLSRQSQLTLLSLLGDTGHWIGDTGCPIASLQTCVFICRKSRDQIYFQKTGSQLFSLLQACTVMS